MFSIRAMMDHFNQMRPYLALAAILFFAGMVVGGTNPQLEDYLTGQLEGIGQIAQTIEASSNPTLFMFLFIFFNNAIKSVLIMYMGALFGIVPVLFVLINGMILGYLYTTLGQSGQNVAMLFLEGIVPHGIIEIPAILIACAYGIKFGMLGFQAIVAMATGKRGIGAQYENFAIRTVPVMVLLIVMLLAAAVIESTFTAWLVSV